MFYFHKKHKMSSDILNHSFESGILMLCWHYCCFCSRFIYDPQIAVSMNIHVYDCGRLKEVTHWVFYIYINFYALSNEMTQVA